MPYFDEEVFEGHILIFLNYLGTSMVVQWLRLHASTTGTWVQPLVQGAKFPYAVQGEAKISNKLSVVKISNMHKKESYQRVLLVTSAA